MTRRSPTAISTTRLAGPENAGPSPAGYCQPWHDSNNGRWRPAVKALGAGVRREAGCPPYPRVSAPQDLDVVDRGLDQARRARVRRLDLQPDALAGEGRQV